MDKIGSALAAADDHLSTLEVTLNQNITSKVVDSRIDIGGGTAWFEITTEISAGTFWLDIDANFGLPGLGMKIDPGSKLGIEFTAAISFIIGYADGGIYLDTQLDNEFVLSGTLKSSDVTVAGTLGVLEVDVELGDADLMTVAYVVDIAKTTNNRRITLSDPGGVSIDHGFTINTNKIQADLTAQFTRNVGAALGAFNPRVTAELVFAAWEPSKDFKVDLNNITLAGIDSSFLTAFANNLGSVIAPLKQVSNALNKDLLADVKFQGTDVTKIGDTSVLGVLEKISGVIPGTNQKINVSAIRQFFTTIDTIDGFLTSVKDLPTGINFGSISFGNAASAANTAVTTTARTDVDNQIRSDTENADFVKYTMSAGAAFKFDIFESPLNVLRLFTINTHNLEELKTIRFFSINTHVSASFAGSKKITVFKLGPSSVFLELSAGIGIKGQVNLGYDGTGIYQYIVDGRQPVGRTVGTTATIVRTQANLLASSTSAEFLWEPELPLSTGLG